MKTIKYRSKKGNYALRLTALQLLAIATLIRHTTLGDTNALTTAISDLAVSMELEGYLYNESYTVKLNEKDNEITLIPS